MVLSPEQPPSRWGAGSLTPVASKRADGQGQLCWSEVPMYRHRGSETSDQPRVLGPLVGEGGLASCPG